MINSATANNFWFLLFVIFLIVIGVVALVFPGACLRLRKKFSGVSRFDPLNFIYESSWGPMFVRVTGGVLLIIGMIFFAIAIVGRGGY